MASTLNDIQGLFCSVIQGISGCPTIQGDQDAPTPKGSYIALRVIDVEVPTHDIDTITDDTNGYQETVRGQSYCNLEIMVIGTGAMDTARKVVNGLQHSARQFDLWETIGYGGFTGPQNLSESYGGMFRQKALVNLYFYANIEFTDQADYITNADIEVIVPTIFDQTIHIPKEV